MTPDQPQDAEVGSALVASAHLEDMSTRKPALPPQSHIAIALAVTEAVNGAPTSDIESLPAKVRESLEYFDEVAEVARAIETEQAEVLKEYYVDTALLLADANADLDVDDAAALVDAFFSSHLMARLLADVAAGNIEPVATVAKTSKAAPKAALKAVETPPADEPSADPDAQPDAPQAEPAKPQGKAAKKAAAPKVAPAPAVADGPSDGTDDFADDPVGDPESEPVLPPDPEEAPARPAPARRGAPPAGVRPLAVDDDDF